MAGYKTMAQARGHRAQIACEGQKHLDAIIAQVGCSKIFAAKYRGRCARCDGSGVIAKNNACVVLNAEILHFECAVHFHQRQQPCETCGATGNLRTEAPISGKQVCAACAVEEILKAQG